MCQVVRLYSVVEIVVMSGKVACWYVGDVSYAVCDVCVHGVVGW